MIVAPESNTLSQDRAPVSWRAISRKVSEVKEERGHLSKLSGSVFLFLLSSREVSLQKYEN